MRPLTRWLLTLTAAITLGVLAFFGTRTWLAGQEPGYARVVVQAPCDLGAGPCHADLPVGTLSFAIAPRHIPLMQTLELRVETRGFQPAAVHVDIRGLNMDMGLNRTVLARLEDGAWRGETILPVCSQREMIWEAAVQIDGATRLEVPFEFRTRRR